MNLLKTSLMALALICLATSCQKDEVVTPEEVNYSIDLNLAHETDWLMADAILSLVNEHRASLGLKEIRRDQQYASASFVCPPYLG